MYSVVDRFSAFLLAILIVIIPQASPDALQNLNSRKVLQLPQEIGDHTLKLLNDLGDMANFNKILDAILIPRVVGTPGHEKVKEYIKTAMAKLHWTIDTDPFSDVTPNLGVLQFENIVATLNPNAERFIVLACHYDSKYFFNETFLGATDSAVPCAMLINLATVLHKYLEQNQHSKAANASMKFIFFDGEEAFKEWNAKDSIYGARHLASEWESQNVLSKIDMLVLLDLLGAPDPQFYSFFKSTENWYEHLCWIEQRFSDTGLMSHYTYSGLTRRHNSNVYFMPKSISAQIEDDHLPFLQRGVPVLHLIPIPFPSVWHTMDDNRDIIDLHTVENLNRILRVFILEYLHITIDT